MRSGSVYTALDSNTSNNEPTNHLPENITDALKKANEVIQGVDVEDMEKIVHLHAYYLMIMYGKETNCPKNILGNIPDNVINDTLIGI